MRGFKPPDRRWGAWYVCDQGKIRCLRFGDFVLPPLLNLEDARHIVEEITLLKTRVNGATPAAAAADPTE